MVERTIFLVEFPFDSGYFKRLGVEVLTENGFRVEIWDLSRILHPAACKKLYSDVKFNCDGLTMFYDKHELCRRLSSLTARDFVFNRVIYRYASFGIYKALSNSGANYSISMADTSPKSQRPVILDFFNKCKKMYPPAPKRLWKLIFHRMPSEWFGIRPANLIFASGTQCFTSNCPRTVKSETVWCHACDYDIYLKELEEPFDKSKTAVFVDQCLPSHRDFAFANLKPYASADEYYPLLDNFLDAVEKKLGLEIIIALHPHSDDIENSLRFKKYRRVKGQTSKLIKESRLVLAHNSTALNFANLFYKPVIFLTSSQLDLTTAGAYIKESARWFGKKPIRMDSDIDEINWDEEMKVDRGIYEDYRECYIKRKSSENLPFWQIVANRLKKGF